MIFHENRLPADDSQEISYNILPYLLFFLKKRQNWKLSSAEIIGGALRVNQKYIVIGLWA